MSSDDSRITTNDLLTHATPTDATNLQPMEGHPWEGDVGLAATMSDAFGQTQLVFTHGDTIIWGEEIVRAQLAQPDDGGMVPAVDFAGLGWSVERAQTWLLGRLSLQRRGTLDLSDLAELAAGRVTADPELAQMAGWDGDQLDDVLNTLAEQQAALNTPAELDDVDPGPPPTDPVTRPGDVWLLGPHRLVCGDSTEALPSAAAVITDPPYGVNERTMRGKAQRGRPSGQSGVDVGKSRWFESNNFDPVIGDDQPFDPSPWLDYPKIVLFGANHYCDRLPPSPTWIVWDKLNGLETDKRDWGFDDNADAELAWSNLGGPARTFSHRWKGLLKDSERQESRVHPTQKPVELFAWLIRRATEPGEVVLDPFAGSGACLMACEQEGRQSVSFELSPAYCDVICRRYQTAVGTKPVLESTGEPHDFGV